MKLSTLNKSLLMVALLFTLTSVSFAQKSTRSEDDARQESDSLTAAKKSHVTTSSNAFSGKTTGGVIDHKFTRRKPRHSFTHLNWSHIKKQASRVGVTAARIAETSGYLPMVPHLWPPMAAQAAPVGPQNRGEQ